MNEQKKKEALVAGSICIGAMRSGHSNTAVDKYAFALHMCFMAMAANGENDPYLHVRVCGKKEEEQNLSFYDKDGKVCAVERGSESNEEHLSRSITSLLTSSFFRGKNAKVKKSSCMYKRLARVAIAVCSSTGEHKDEIKKLFGGEK